MKLNLPQQQALIKAFRLLRKGASEAEVILATMDTNPSFAKDLTDTSRDIARLVHEIDHALHMAIGATAALDMVTGNKKTKPSVKRAKPRLRVVRGGKA